MISPAYAAGFFDGEGYVGMTHRGKTRQLVLRVVLVNTDLRVLGAFQAQFGGSIRLTRAQTHWKQVGHLTLNHGKAINFLRVVHPYVLVKREQVDLALAFVEFKRKPGRRVWTVEPGHRNPIGRLTPETKKQEDEFRQQFRVLNRKGA